MDVNVNTKFDEIWDEFKPGRFTLESVHLRGDVGLTELYKHGLLELHGKGAVADARRKIKYSKAGPIIRRAIDKQYGPGTAKRVFEGIPLGDEITVRDLRRIHNALLQRAATKSDLSQLKDPTKRENAYIVFRGGTEELDHASDAFRKFLQDNRAVETVEFLDAYHALHAEPTVENLEAFVENVLKNEDTNVYGNSKEKTLTLLAKLGKSPSWEEISEALKPVMDDFHESFEGHYSKFLGTY
jgi:hypothetical protein